MIAGENAHDLVIRIKALSFLLVPLLATLGKSKQKGNSQTINFLKTSTF
jgi:hypothetical protein